MTSRQHLFSLSDLDNVCSEEDWNCHASAIFGSSHLLTSIIPRQYAMQMTFPVGVSNGSNISANGAEANEGLSFTIVFSSPNNFSTRLEEVVNLEFGEDIMRRIPFHKKLAQTLQIALVHSGEGVQLRCQKTKKIL